MKIYKQSSLVFFIIINIYYNYGSTIFRNISTGAAAVIFCYFEKKKFYYTNLNYQLEKEKITFEEKKHNEQKILTRYHLFLINRNIIYSYYFPFFLL